MDRAGKRISQIGDSDFYNDIHLSRDGLKLAVNIGRDAGDLWLHDLGRDVRTRFTFDPADDSTPVFSPDGMRVAFVSARKGVGDLYWRDARGTGEDVFLFSSGTQMSASDWSPDGKLIVLSSLNRKTGFDLWTYSLQEKKAEPWLEGPLDQFQARISPNGRWIAYSSTESGHQEVYVQAFPSKGEGRWQVSRGGGQPTWRADGKEIYYLTTDGNMMAADVRTDGDFDVGTPRLLFKAPFKSTTGSGYDVGPDGKRFVANLLKANDRSGQSTTIVLNWLAALRK